MKKGAWKRRTAKIGRLAKRFIKCQFHGCTTFVEVVEGMEDPVLCGEHEELVRRNQRIRRKQHVHH